MLLGKLTIRDLTKRGWRAIEIKELLPPPKERDGLYGPILYWDIQDVVKAEKAHQVGLENKLTESSE